MKYAKVSNGLETKVKRKEMIHLKPKDLNHGKYIPWLKEASQQITRIMMAVESNALM